MSMTQGDTRNWAHQATQSTERRQPETKAQLSADGEMSREANANGLSLDGKEEPFDEHSTNDCPH